MFFNNYSKPGKGVNKRDPNMSRRKVFFDVFPRKLWDLFKLNLLNAVISIPFFVVAMVIVGVVSSPVINAVASEFKEIELVGIDVLFRIVLAFWFMVFLGFGPAAAGFTYIIREHANERPCWLISDFFENFKTNFKQSFVLWLIDLAVLYLMTTAIGFYGQMGVVVLQYVLIVVAVIWLMMHIYIYQMMITFELPLKHLIKNSLLLALGKAPMNLLLLVFNVVVFVVLPIYFIMSAGGVVTVLIVLLLEALILPSVAGFVRSFCISPVLEQYVNVENSQKVTEEQK